MELEIASNDGITYKGDIEDIIQLSKEQRSKLKFLTLVANSPLIERDGIEIPIDERQEKTVLKAIQKMIGKNSISDLAKEVKELVAQRVVIFPSQIQHNQMPDPQRNCIQKRIAISRLVAAGKILKINARFNSENKQINHRLAYLAESSIDSGKLLVSFLEDQFIVILKANISEGELRSVFSAELLEMANNNALDYTLSEMECPCGGRTSPILTDITYHFDDKDIVVESVPVLICSKCNQIYDDALVSMRTENQAFKAMKENKDKTDF